MKTTKIPFIFLLVTLSLFVSAQNKPIVDIAVSAGTVIPIESTYTMYYNLLNPGTAYEINGSVQFKRVGLTLAVSQTETGILNNKKYLDLSGLDNINYIKNPTRSTLQASLRARLKFNLNDRIKMYGFFGAGYSLINYTPFEINGFLYSNWLGTGGHWVQLDYSAPELQERGILSEVGYEMEYILNQHISAHFRIVNQLLFYTVASSYYQTHSDIKREYQMAPQYNIQLGLNYRLN